MTVNLLSGLLIIVFLMPKFDKKFASALMMLYGMKPLSRSYLYTLQKFPPQYDFKSQTNKFERVISYACIIPLYFFVLLILFFGAHYLSYCIESMH